MRLRIIKNDLVISELDDEVPINWLIVVWWIYFVCEGVVDQAGCVAACFESVHG